MMTDFTALQRPPISHQQASTTDEQVFISSIMPVFLYYLHTLRLINVGHQFNDVERHNSNFSSMRNWTSASDGHQS